MPSAHSLRPSLTTKFAAAGLAVLIACVGCELAARMIFPAPPESNRQPQIAYVYDPDIRYFMAPSQKGWIDDGFLSINSLGFRGREVDVPKPAGRLRIAVIGDSVTMGWGVQDDETFSARLGSLLRQKYPGRDLDVVNLGVGGYDTRQEVTLLARHLDELQPDLVLVGFYSNDPADAADDNGGAVGGTRVAAEHPVAGQHLQMNPTPTGGWNARLRKSRAIYVVGRAINRILGKGEWGMVRYSMELDMLKGEDSPALDQAWGTVGAQFARLGSLATKYHFAVGVIALPCKEQVMGQYPKAKYQTRLRAIVEPLGFPFIDPLAALTAHKGDGGDLYIPYDRNHPSAAGHQIIAGTIASFLEEHSDLLSLHANVRPS